MVISTEPVQTSLGASIDAAHMNIASVPKKIVLARCAEGFKHLCLNWIKNIFSGISQSRYTALEGDSLTNQSAPFCNFPSAPPVKMLLPIGMSKSKTL